MSNQSSFILCFLPRIKFQQIILSPSDLKRGSPGGGELIALLHQSVVTAAPPDVKMIKMRRKEGVHVTSCNGGFGYLQLPIVLRFVFLCLLSAALFELLHLSNYSTSGAS